MNPLVTIVVVSYNQSQFIEENLNSIKAQTYSNIQLIVADDASTDNSVEVFDNWLSKNNYLAIKNYHKKNTGLATTLNESIDLAEGKYIKLIAADDYLAPNAIEKCINKLEEIGDEYGMVYSDTYSVNDDSTIIEDVADYFTVGNLNSKERKKELIKGNRIPALTVVMHRKALIETGKYDTKFLVEDYYRWLKINEKYLIAYIPEKLSYYRVHNNNISQIKSERIKSETIVLQIMFDQNGVVKDRINGYIQEKYLTHSKINDELKFFYHTYPFKVKRLNFCLQNKIPPSIYKLACKIL